MKILKNILGEKAKLYHIYTSSTPRYIGGSAGIAFYKGKLVMSIRQSTNIPIGGYPHYDYGFIENHTTPYLNNSICRIGMLDPDVLKLSDPDTPIYLHTEEFRPMPSRDKGVFRGLEDPRLAVWGDTLYIYGTQFTDEYPYAEALVYYIPNSDMSGFDKSGFLPGITHYYGKDYLSTEKNWMAIPGNEMDFVYMVSAEYKPNGVFPSDSGNFNIVPVKYSDLSTNLSRFEGTVPVGVTMFRGSTPLVEYNGGYMCIVHNSERIDGKLNYKHHIGFIDKDFTSFIASEEFIFEQTGIEFTTGWCLDDSGNLYISYSTTDGTTNLLVTTPDDLVSRVTGKDYGVVKSDPKFTAEILFKTNPIDAAQYYWKCWMQYNDKDSLYSHYAILLHYLDRYLLPAHLDFLEDDNSIDALILKIFNHRRTHQDYTTFYNMLDMLPGNWKSGIQNKYIKMYNFEKLII